MMVKNVLTKKKMKNREKYSNDKKYGISIGPIGDDPDSVIENILRFVKDKNEGKNIHIENKKISPDQLFAVFTVNSMEESKAFTDLNGYNNILISRVDIREWKRTCEILQENFPNMVHDQKTLNLSCLPEMGITDNLYFPQNTSFVLFYSALLCQQEKVNVKKLVYKGNNITNLQGFYPVSIFFPNLKKIVIPKNVEVADIFKEIYKIVQDDSNEYHLTQENPWDKIGFPIITYPNTFLTDPDITERSTHYHLHMYKPVKLNPDFIGNSIIIEFYKQAWEDIESLSKFYVNDTIFSITVNYHSPNSPLCYYDKFSRNLLFANNINNYIIGKDNIVLAQKELFGDHFYAYVTSVHEMIMLPQYISIVTHGVFQLNDDVMGFDRTMNVAFNETQSAIINDHILIRSPEKPQ